MNNEVFIAKFDIRKLKLDSPQTVLMVGAHPDDIEINTAGLNAVLKEFGSNINWLTCSDGGSGSWDSNIDRNHLIETRRNEQLRAADLLGISRVTFLDIPDGLLMFNQQQLLEAIVKEIRDIKPRLVVTHDPWKQYELHADHRAVGFMTSHAAIMASNSSFLPGKDPHFTKIIGYFNPESPNLWVNIEKHSNTKDQAILQHASQFGNRTTFVDMLRVSEINASIPQGRVEVFHFLENH